MKLVYIFIVTFGFASCQADRQHPGKISGILLMSSWRTHQSFDVFLPYNIDSSITLEDNLQRVRTDTAYQTFSSRDFAFDAQVIRLRNQAFDDSFADHLKYCLILPITAVHDTVAERLFRNIGAMKLLECLTGFLTKLCPNITEQDKLT